MTDETNKPWEPEPTSEEAFQGNRDWSNINRAPYDEVSGVLYKRNVNIKRVRYPQDEAELVDPLIQGSGDMVIRWLFSEMDGTQENKLAGKQFAMMQDIELADGACAAEQTQEGLDLLIYVMSGEGKLHHRPDAGSPVITRPLRPGDAIVIWQGERYAWAHDDAANALRLLVVGLK